MSRGTLVAAPSSIEVRIDDGSQLLSREGRIQSSSGSHDLP
jgi:hypothetical protein